MTHERQRAALINVDSFFEPTWSEELGDRVFPFDAFLSHNRADGSDQLATALRDKGLKVWHDSDADVRDRRVQQAIGMALWGSRYVVVCVTANFRDSHWVRAEYLNALSDEKRAAATRVIVAEMEPGAVVPKVLRDRLRFSVHGDGLAN